MGDEQNDGQLGLFCELCSQKYLVKRYHEQ